MKSQHIGILLIVVGFGAMIWQSMQENKARQEHILKQQEQVEQLAAESAQSEATSKQPYEATQNELTSIATQQESDSLVHRTSSQAADAFAGEPADIARTPEETYTLENDFIRVTFTSYGGAIKHVALIGRDVNDKLLYPATLEAEEPYQFNKHNPKPALGLLWGELATRDNLPNAPVYTLIGQKDNLIQFRHTTASGVEIIRGYQLVAQAEQAENTSKSDPYLIRHETSFRNPTEEAFTLSRVHVNTGALLPTEGDNLGRYQNVAYYDGYEEDVDMIHATEFLNRSGVLGFGAHRALPYLLFPNAEDSAPLQVNWAGVKNQFFAGIIMPSEPGVSIYATGYPLDKNPAGDERVALTGYVGFDLGELEAGSKRVLGIDYYVGPKEYDRLVSLGDEKEELMQFGWGPISFIGKVLLAALTGLHALLVHISPEWAWGWAIVILTIIVKSALFPLTAIQIRSSKKMQAIQEPMKAMREKYQNDPQRMQVEMMKLFKENQINPMAGCLPMLVQIPIFIGLFYMLQTASQLRFGSFLWVEDLSVPDTVSWLPVIPYDIWLIGGPIHVLPILMCVSMYFQMRMMPTPTTDNAQVKIFRLMPFIFFPITYSFPSGVTLYWTMSNLLTILQTYLTRDMRAAPAELKPAAKTTKKSRKTGSTRKK